MRVNRGALGVSNLDKKLDFLDTEFSQLFPEPYEKNEVRLVDKLVKVFKKDGTEEWLLIHIEVQGATKKGARINFPERMFKYFYRCVDKCRRPVTAIAIYCGSDQECMGNCYQYECLGTKLSYEFNCIKISDYSDEMLSNSNNPFAWALLAAKQALMSGKKFDEKLLEGKLFVFRKLIAFRKIDLVKLRAVLLFLNNYVLFRNTRTHDLFSQQIDKVTQKNNHMYIEDAIREFEIETRAMQIAEKLMLRTDLSDEEIMEITGLTPALLQETRDLRED